MKGKPLVKLGMKRICISSRLYSLWHHLLESMLRVYYGTQMPEANADADDYAVLKSHTLQPSHVMTP